MNPDISFVIPVKDGESYLAETLGSCVSQSHKNIEAVVVNDYSTDNTQDIIDFYVKNDSRIRCIKNSGSPGRSYARNLGSESAKSKIIAVLDADDINDRDRAKNTLELLDGEFILYGAAAHIDCLSREHNTLKTYPFDIDRVLKECTTRITHPTMAYPKSIWEKIKYDVGEYSELGVEDFKFVLDAYSQGIRIVGTDKVLAAYRYHEKATTQTRDEDKVFKLKKVYLNGYKIPASV